MPPSCRFWRVNRPFTPKKPARKPATAGASTSLSAPAPSSSRNSPKDRLVVERFEDYHGEQPYLDQIEMYNMDANTMLLEYESGNLDIVGVQQDQADAYRNDEAFADQFVINPLIGTISMRPMLKWRRWIM